MTDATNDTSLDDEVSYAYDETNAAKADKAADTITEGGAYIGKFVRAEATKSEKTGTQGIVLAFEAPGSGNAEFTLWTRKEDGTEVFGMAQVQAIMFLLGVKSLKSVKGKITKWEEVEGKGRQQVETEGNTFPDLCGKPIGIVLQKELYSKQGGKGDGSRMGLHGLFQPETKLMMSEIKERKTSPVKLERLLKGLKVKDTRKSDASEPGQPSMGTIGGDY